jgi:outer membrane protein assembly factor BamB
MTPRLILTILLLVGVHVPFPRGHSGVWPMWGHDETHNMVSREKSPPTEWDRTSGRNIRWVADLGNRCCASPIVADGFVWIGTNNENPRDPKRAEDGAVLMCFREADGKFLWQYVCPRINGNADCNQDRPTTGLGGSPLVEGDRLWFITNRGEVVCLDLSPLIRHRREPEVLWTVDMSKEWGVYRRGGRCPGNLFSSSIVGHKSWLYVSTGNGVDGSDKPPAPNAPCLVCLRKDNGELLWKDNSPGQDILEGHWASPLAMEIAGRSQVIMPQGDGWVRSFDAATGKLFWKCDLNPKDAGTSRNHAIATPVYHQGRVYIGSGLDPTGANSVGPGWLLCLDPTRSGDISSELPDRKTNPNSGVIWGFGGPLPSRETKDLDRDYLFGHTISTCVIHDGLVYVPEVEGVLHCLDARTGKEYWQHHLKAAVYASPIWADGAIYIGNEDGDVWIFAHGKTKSDPKRMVMESNIYSSLVFANHTLYVPTQDKLYAIQRPR